MASLHNTINIMSKRVVAPVPSARRLQIQIGVCKRLVKEVAYYEAEVLTNEARVQKMRDDGKDSYGEFQVDLITAAI